MADEIDNNSIVDSNNFFYTFLLIATLIYLLYSYVFGYWKRKNIFSPPKVSFILGHVDMKIPFIEKFAEYHKDYKYEQFLGLNFMSLINLLLVRDLDLIKNVLTKDYSYFEGHGLKAHKDVDPLAQHLFNLEGEEWRRIRVKLTPTFTSSKMKYMFNAMNVSNEEMVEYLKNEIKINNVIEVKEVTAELGTNVIASCAFGLESNCFLDSDSEFRKFGKKHFELSLFEMLYWFMSMFCPNLAKMSRISITKKEVAEFMTNVVRQTIDFREKNNVQRNDFLQLLIDMKNADEKSGNQLTFNELAAQVFVFFIAGYETSSSAAHFALFELARNPKVKQALTKEIDESIEANAGKITYELLQNMPLMDQVVDESMRKYPPVPILTRRCTKNYRIPGSDTVIENGTGIVISVLGIHYDPEIYPEPEKFIPERFSPANKKNRHPYAYLPFGEGPRNCIGSRFGIMQLKLNLISFLRNFDIELSPRTELPLKFNKMSFLMHSEKGIYVKLSPRK